MFEVMITIVLRKSTVRPWASVSRPSSRIWSRMLKTSGCAFSISSSSRTRVRLAAHRLGELAALVVADVARRRADQPRDGVLLHVLGHVDADHRVLVAEQELGQRAGQLGLADAGRAQEDERAGRPLRVLESRRASGGSPSRRPSIAACWPITRLCSSSSIRISFLVSASVSLKTGIPVHIETMSAISSSPISGRSPRLARAHWSSSSRFLFVSWRSLSRRLAAFSNSCASIAASLARRVSSISSSSSR